MSNFGAVVAALAAQAVQGVHADPLVEKYAHSLGRLMEHASRWAAVSASGLPCAIHVAASGGPVRCSSPAIGVCVVCQGPVCFAHAMLAPMNGDMCCFACIARAQGITPEAAASQAAERKSPPRPRDDGPRCSCKNPWQLDGACPVHGKASKDDAERVRRRHLRTLDLDEEADWEDIRFAYKKLVVLHHPDRHPPAKKKRQEVRMSKINAAYDWLKKHYQEEAA